MLVSKYLLVPQLGKSPERVYFGHQCHHLWYMSKDDHALVDRGIRKHLLPLQSTLGIDQRMIYKVEVREQY